MTGNKLKPLLASAIAITGVLFAGTVPVDTVEQYYVRESPKESSQFKGTLDSSKIDGLVKANIIGRACYIEFRNAKDTLREKIDCEEYWRIAHTPDYPPPHKDGYEWFGYDTYLFDTPSGDLEEGYYAAEPIESRTILDILTEPEVAEAAIAYDTTSNAAAIAAACSASWSHTVTGSNTVLAVGTAGRDATLNDTLVNSVTYNGVNLAQANGAFTTGWVTTEIWTMVAPASGTNTVAVTFCTTGSLTVGGVFAISLTGVDQTNHIDSLSDTGLTGNSEIASSTLVTVAENAWLVDSMLTTEDAASNITAGGTSSHLERVEIGLASDNHTGGTSGPISPAGLTENTWTWTGAETWAHTIVGFKPFVESSVSFPRRVLIID